MEARLPPADRSLSHRQLTRPANNLVRFHELERSKGPLVGPAFHFSVILSFYSSVDPERANFFFVIPSERTASLSSRASGLLLCHPERAERAEGSRAPFPPSKRRGLQNAFSTPSRCLLLLGSPGRADDAPLLRTTFQPVRSPANKQHLLTSASGANPSHLPGEYICAIISACTQRPMDPSNVTPQNPTAWTDRNPQTCVSL